MANRKSGAAWAGWLAGAVVGFGGYARAVDVTVETIVTEADIEPLPVGVDSVLFEDAGVVNGQISFEAGGIPGLTRQGVYAGGVDGPYSLLYPGDVTVPGRPGPTALQFFQSNGADVVSINVTPDPGGGAFVDLFGDIGSTGTLTPIILEGDFRAEVGGTYNGTGLTEWDVDGQAVAIRGGFTVNGVEEAGVYRVPIDGGPIQTLLVEDTPWPGFPNRNVELARVQRGGYDDATQTVAVHVATQFADETAIYTVGPNQAPALLIESDSVDLPGTALGSSYEILNGIQIDGDDVVFEARDGGDSGIYGFLDGALTKVVDTATPVPGATAGETFSGFFAFTPLVNPFSLDDGRVFFYGDFPDDSGPETAFLSGLFLWDDGEIHEIARTNGQTNDTLQIFDFLISEDALDGDTAVFGVLLVDLETEATFGEIWKATFTDGTSLLGDYDGSGQVEQGDLDIVLQNWGTGTSTGDEGALVGGGPFDGTVDQNELDGVLQNWGSTASPDFGGAAVPEPGALGLLGVVVLGRRRRRPGMG